MKGPRLRTRLVRRSIPSVKTPAKTKTVTVVKKKQVSATDFFTDVINVFKKTLNNPMAIMVMALSLFLVLSHSANPTTGPLSTFITKLITNPSTKTTGEWIKGHLTNLVGVIIFLPTIFAMPESKRTLVAVGSVAWCCMIPESSPMQYMLQSLILLCFFKVPKSSDKLILIGIVVFAHLVGKLGIFYPVTE